MARAQALAEYMVVTFLVGLLMLAAVQRYRRRLDRSYRAAEAALRARVEQPIRRRNATAGTPRTPLRFKPPEHEHDWVPDREDPRRERCVLCGEIR